MTHLEAVQELIEAIDYDRFTEIEALHAPGATFHSFRGPILHDAISIGDWHREFNRNYADLTYTENELIEDGDTVAVRTTFDAKGYDFRRFSQRALDVFELDSDDLVVHRRLYAMLRDLEFEKPVQTAYDFAVETRGGSVSGTRSAVTKFYESLLGGDAEGLPDLLHDKSAYIDSVYGVAAGKDAFAEIWAMVPRPAFGAWQIAAITAGDNAAVVELVIDPTRPRLAHFVRVVEGKIAVIEAYWMIRELGMNPFEEYARDRQHRRANLPI